MTRKASTREQKRTIEGFAGGKQPRTIFTDLATVGHDEDFYPVPATHPTSALAGTVEKIEVMRIRVSLGQDIFHPSDNRHYQLNHRLVINFALRDIFPAPEPEQPKKSLDYHA